MKWSPDKTDLGDTGLLADLTRVNYLPKVWLAPESTSAQAQQKGSAPSDSTVAST